jgi:hypothetical protein
MTTPGNTPRTLGKTKGKYIDSEKLFTSRKTLVGDRPFITAAARLRNTLPADGWNSFYEYADALVSYEMTLGVKSPIDLRYCSITTTHLPIRTLLHAVVTGKVIPEQRRWLKFFEKVETDVVIAFDEEGTSAMDMFFLTPYPGLSILTDNCTAHNVSRKELNITIINADILCGSR